MNDITIWVEGFSARYCIGQRERDNALRDVLTDAFTSPFRRLWGNSQFAIRNSKLRPALGAPFPRFTFHVLRFTIRSSVPVSLRMSKVTKVATSPISCRSCQNVEIWMAGDASDLTSVGTVKGRLTSLVACGDP